MCGDHGHLRIPEDVSASYGCLLLFYLESSLTDIAGDVNENIVNFLLICDHALRGKFILGGIVVRRSAQCAPAELAPALAINPRAHTVRPYGNTANIGLKPAARQYHRRG